MTNAEPMNLRDSMQETFGILDSIVLPALPATRQVEMAQLVALPIMQAMGNLQNMMEAIDSAAEQPDPDTEEKAIREEDL